MRDFFWQEFNGLEQTLCQSFVPQAKCLLSNFMDTKLKHFTISTLLAFLCKRQGLNSPIVADKPASQKLKVLFPKRCFCRYQPVEQTGSEQWKSLQMQGYPGPPRGPCPRKENRGRITSPPPQPSLPSHPCISPNTFDWQRFKDKPRQESRSACRSSRAGRTRCRAAGRHLPGNLRGAGSRAGRARHRNILQ